jgi:hypothetical protein
LPQRWDGQHKAVAMIQGEGGGNRVRLRKDGKVGTSSGENSGGRGVHGPDGKFLLGASKPEKSGRKRGTPNKLKAEMTELRSEFDGDAEPAALPAASPAKPDTNTGANIQDELEFLRWVWQNPEHRLELRLKACSEAAQYRYAKKRELSAAPGDGERPTMRIIIEGMEPIQPPAPEHPQPFQEPAKPSPPAPVLPPAETVSIRPAPPKETATSANLAEERRDPREEEARRRENRRLDVPPVAPEERPLWKRRPGDPLPG